MPEWLTEIFIGKKYGCKVLSRRQDFEVAAKPGIKPDEPAMPEECGSGFHSCLNELYNPRLIIPAYHQ